RARGADAPMADGPPARTGDAVPRDRRARADLDGDRDPRRPVAAARRPPLTPRTRPPREGPAVTAAFSRAGADGRLKLAVPAKGRTSEPAPGRVAHRGPALEAPHC